MAARMSAFRLEADSQELALFGLTAMSASCPFLRTEAECTQTI